MTGSSQEKRRSLAESLSEKAKPIGESLLKPKKAKKITTDESVLRAVKFLMEWSGDTVASAKPNRRGKARRKKARPVKKP